MRARKGFDNNSDLFLYAFAEWTGEMLRPHGLHIAIDGKELRAALSKVKGGRVPMLMNAIEVASGLVLAQLPIDNKDCEIKISRPNTELMDLLHDDLNLLGTYIFDGIVALS